MTFESLTEDEFRKFLSNHPLKTFLQTPEIGKLRTSNGWNYEFVGVKENKKLVAATMLLSKKEFKGHFEFYSPRGLLVDYQDKKLLTFFVNELKKYINDKDGYILRIDPYLIKQQRDINGDIVENGVDNRNVIGYLEELGFVKSAHDEQAAWAFSLDLENMDEDKIMKNMKSNVRNIIRKAIKNGIKIRELNYDSLSEFKAITESTSARREFVDKPLSYYQDMYNLYHNKDEVKYIIAEINLKEYKQGLVDELEDTIKKINEYEKNNRSHDGKFKNAEIRKKDLEKQIKDANNLIDEADSEVIPLSAAMFMTFGDEVLYLCSGTDGKYMFFNGQYLIQWYMIKWGLEHKFKKYNFYGISGNFDKSHPQYGIYKFKKGFNGYVEETIGEYELPINNIYYKYCKYLKFKNFIKKILRRK